MKTFLTALLIVSLMAAFTYLILAIRDDLRLQKPTVECKCELIALHYQAVHELRSKEVTCP